MERLKEPPWNRLNLRTLLKVTHYGLCAVGIRAEKIRKANEFHLHLKSLLTLKQLSVDTVRGKDGKMKGAFDLGLFELQTWGGEKKRRWMFLLFLCSTLCFLCSTLWVWNSLYYSVFTFYPDQIILFIYFIVGKRHQREGQMSSPIVTIV